MNFLESIQTIIDGGKESLDEKKLAYKERKKLTKAQFVFPKESGKVKDKKDHFPIPDESHARNALSRAGQYKKVPEWFKGNLSELKKAIQTAVKKKFPSIKVGGEEKKK